MKCGTTNRVRCSRTTRVKRDAHIYVNIKRVAEDYPVQSFEQQDLFLNKLEVFVQSLTIQQPNLLWWEPLTPIFISSVTRRVDDVIRRELETMLSGFYS